MFCAPRTPPFWLISSRPRIRTGADRLCRCWQTGRQWVNKGDFDVGHDSHRADSQRQCSGYTKFDGFTHRSSSLEHRSDMSSQCICSWCRYASAGSHRSGISQAFEAVCQLRGNSNLSNRLLRINVSFSPKAICAACASYYVNVTPQGTERQSLKYAASAHSGPIGEISCP